MPLITENGVLLDCCEGCHCDQKLLHCEKAQKFLKELLLRADN